MNKCDDKRHVWSIQRGGHPDSLPEGSDPDPLALCDCGKVSWGDWKKEVDASLTALADEQREAQRGLEESLGGLMRDLYGGKSATVVHPDKADDLIDFGRAHKVEEVYKEAGGRLVGPYRRLKMEDMVWEDQSQGVGSRMLQAESSGLTCYVYDAAHVDSVTREPSGRRFCVNLLNLDSEQDATRFAEACLKLRALQKQHPERSLDEILYGSNG